MKLTILIAGVSLCAAAVRAEPSVTNRWVIDKNASRYVKIEGNLLTVDVPADETNVCAYARLPLDLKDWAQSVLETEVMCRGENVGTDPRPARGVKLSLHYRDPETGDKRYPFARDPKGTFGWTRLALSVPFGEVPPTESSKPTLVLGLQQVSGKVQFDLSTFRFRKMPPLYVREDNDRVITYPPRHADRPPLRGVMGRGACRNTEQDIEDLHRYGATLIRLQMNGFASRIPKSKKPTLEAWNAWFARNLDHAEEVLGWLEKRDMRMVLDLHNPPLGGYGTRCDTFVNAAYAARFISAWEEIARRFKGRKGIYGYDLINEPAQIERALPDCDYWNLQRRAAEAIRRIDPDATIVIESNDWDSPDAFRYLRALDMDNVVYQAHMYKPGWFTHQGANGAACPAPDKLQAYPNPARGIDKEKLREILKPVRDFQLRHKARILIGEFSASIYAPGAGKYLEDCIDIFNEYGWDWTYHSFREAKWWNVETVLDEKGKPVPNFDNPRFHALVNGFRKGLRLTPPVAKDRLAEMRGVLCLTFDDRNFADWAAALPLFEKYGAHASFFVCGAIDEEALKTMRRLRTAGHTVGIHTVGHGNAPTNAAPKEIAAWFDAQVEPQLKALRAAGFPVRCMAYPNNRHDEAVDRYVQSRTGFSHLRAGARGIRYNFKGDVTPETVVRFDTVEMAYKPVEWAQGKPDMNGIGIGPVYCYSRENVFRALRRAAERNEMVTFYSHSIKPDNTDWVGMRTDWLEEILSEAKRLGLSVVGFDEL